MSKKKYLKCDFLSEYLELFKHCISYGCSLGRDIFWEFSGFNCSPFVCCFWAFFCWEYFHFLNHYHFFLSFLGSIVFTYLLVCFSILYLFRLLITTSLTNNYSCLFTNNSLNLCLIAIFFLLYFFHSQIRAFFSVCC